MDSRLKLVLTGDPEECLSLLVRLKKPEVVPFHCHVMTQFDDIITCRVKRKHLLDVYHSPATFSVKARRLIPAPLKEETTPGQSPPGIPDSSRRVNAPYTGKGVYFAAVDWGFDFAHANLRKPDGTTRFANIWDQNGIYDGNRYGYGCLYSEDEINEALKSDTPYQTLGYHPGKTDFLHNGMHGTHVVDIAAGTRVIGEGGIAPGTTLIGVELGTNLVNGSDLALGDSCCLVEALDFIHSATKNAPCVINMSLGSHGDSHTGKSLVELAFDNFLLQHPGYALVQSVGNYYQANCHIHYTMGQGQHYRMEWNIPRRNRAPNEVEIWYAGPDEYALSLTAPDGEIVAEVQPFEDIQISYRGDPVGYVFHRAHEPNTGLNHIDVILDTTILTGKWIIELTGKKVTDGSFHAYCERNDASQARFSAHQSTPYTTTGSVCNSGQTITVGAYDHRDTHRPVVAFSSSGPTVFGQPKPDLLAPGYKIAAACSASPSTYNATNGLTIKSGSSMSSPHTSGAIALLFEKYKPQRLPVSVVKELLLGSLDPLPGHYTQADRIRAGKGFLNTERLLTDKSTNMNANYYTRPARHLEEQPEAAAEAGDHVYEEATYGDSSCEAESSGEENAQYEELLSEWNEAYADEDTGCFHLYRHFHPRYNFHYTPYEAKFKSVVLKTNAPANGPQAGDLILQRQVLNNKTYQGVIIEPGLVTRETMNGLSYLFQKPGWYLKVYGNFNGHGNQVTYVRVLDANNRVADDVVILRKYENAYGNGQRTTADSYKIIRGQNSLMEDDGSSLSPALTTTPETTPPAETLYVAIDLGLRKECSRRDPATYACTEHLKYDVEAKTGIFLPAACTARPKIDLLLYLHGHKSGYVKNGRDMAIDSFWNKGIMPLFAFRELLNDSGRDMILAVPTLGPFSQPGTLTTSTGFTSFIRQVLHSIAQYSSLYKGKTPPTIQSIILAAHSGGGIHMRSIASLAGKNPYASLIKECWGFDCTYSKDDPAVWYEWAGANPDKALYLYSIPGTSTSAKAGKLSEKEPALPNIHSFPSATNDHNSVPKVHMQERLSGKGAGGEINKKGKAPNGKSDDPLAVITASVGKGGQNHAGDVLKVQALLNGAGIPIPITGQVAGSEGDATILAIYHYQKRKKLPYYDGKIDPHGSTIRSLVQNAKPNNLIKPDIPPVPPPVPGPADPVLEAELAIHPNSNARYKTVQAYKKVRDQVASWKIANPAGYIEDALQQWNANPDVHPHFDRNFDGDPHRSYLNLKRHYEAKKEKITDPAAYFKANLISARFFNKTTPAHQELGAALNRAEATLTSAGNNFTLDSAWSFVPRTLNNNINKLSNHALGKAIDINPGSNPHITSKDEIKVINAACQSILPNGLLRESDPDVLRNASAHFQQTFNDTWIAQQTGDLAGIIAKRRSALNSYAAHGFLTLPSTLIRGLMNAGLNWGGSWNSGKDFMHFELPNA